jgi:hypothetical protein
MIMEIVDVNVCKLDKYNMEDEYYFEPLWEKMFDDGLYTDNYNNEAVGFIYSNACHAEVYDNEMVVTWIRDCADSLRLAIVANDLVNNLMGTEKKKIITEENNRTTLLTDDGIYLDIFVNFEMRHIQILAYHEA